MTKILGNAPRFAVFVGAATFLSAAVAQVEIPNGYDGYARVPGPTRAAPSYYLLLSQDKCPTKGTPAKWKKGAYLYRSGVEGACWTMSGSNVKMCPRGQYDTVFKQTDYGTTTTIPCHIWPLDNFYEARR